jgi:HK97 family phage portal protein
MHQDIESRETTPEDPGRSSHNDGHLYFLDGFRVPQSDPPVDERTALTYTAVWACRRVISQTIACLGWHVFERSEDGRTRKPIEDDVAWMLGMQASPELNAFEWRQVMINDALGGNAFAEIERTGSGRPNWMHRICPSRVTLYRDDLGRLLYEIRNQGADSTYLRPEDVFHLRGPSPDGLVGYSVVQMFRRSIGLGISTERYGRTFFDRGPMPGGVLTAPGTIKKDARDELRESFQKIYGGAENAGRIVVLWGDMKFQAADLANDDAQFLQSRGYNVYDICRIYGVPPHKVAQLERATFSNIEHQSIEFVQDCILPWARRLEVEADIKLYGRINRGRRYTRLNLGTLLRGDTAAQTAAVKDRVSAGLYTINEGREYLDMDPDPQGDVLLVQGAMTTLDRVINPPEPPRPAPAQTTNGGDTPPERDEDAVADAFRGLFADAYGRQLKKEAVWAQTADRQGRLRAWSETFYGADLEARVAAAITPVVQALLAASGRGAGRVGELAGRLAADHAAVSLDELQAGVKAVGWWERGRPSVQADRHLGIILEAIK